MDRIFDSTHDTIISQDDSLVEFYRDGVRLYLAYKIDLAVRPVARERLYC